MKIALEDFLGIFDALKIREEAYKRQAKRQAAKDAIKSPEH